MAYLLETAPTLFDFNRTTALIVPNLSNWQQFVEFLSDKRNLALYVIIPLFVILVGSCIIIYATHLLRRQLRRRRRTKRLRLINDMNDDKMLIPPDHPQHKPRSLTGIQPLLNTEISNETIDSRSPSVTSALEKTERRVTTPIFMESLEPLTSSTLTPTCVTPRPSPIPEKRQPIKQKRETETSETPKREDPKLPLISPTTSQLLASTDQKSSPPPANPRVISVSSDSTQVSKKQMISISTECVCRSSLHRPGCRHFKLPEVKPTNEKLTVKDINKAMKDAFKKVMEYEEELRSNPAIKERLAKYRQKKEQEKMKTNNESAERGDWQNVPIAMILKRKREKRQQDLGNMQC